MIAATMLMLTASPDALAQGIVEFPVPTASLTLPTGIAAGPDGSVWFTDGLNFQSGGQTSLPIGRITPAGAITQFSLADQPFEGTSGIVTGPDGALWFTGLAANVIGRITTAGNATSFPIPTHNSGPMNIVVGSDGALWFTESSVGKIGRITTSGAITEFPTLQSPSQPHGITAGPDGALWFTDFAADLIGRITTTGVLTTFPIKATGRTLIEPDPIAAGPDGALWFGTSDGGAVIGRITTSGQLTTFPVSVVPQGGMVAGPDGALWFTAFFADKIGRITTAGTVTLFSVPNSNSGVNQIIVGPDGNLWFTEKNGGAIGRLSLGPSGSGLVAAVLPSSRSVQVGNTATAFATIINSGASAVSGCAITPVTTVPASFVYQTTNPATNALTGSPNTPASIAAGGSQSFVIAFTPNAAFVPTNVVLGFACSGVSAAPSTTGLNTLLLSASATPVPDIVALAATASNDGILHITGTSGSNAFAVATVNVGASASITATANTGTATLPLAISLCQTNPMTGQCISSVGPNVTTTINANATPTFGIFATANGAVPFDPANNRIFVSFSDAGGTIRGSTSVAVETQ
jgi:streptogramin lyase